MLEPDDRIAQLYSQAEQQAEAVFKPTIPINRFFRNIFISDTLDGHSGTVTYRVQNNDILNVFQVQFLKSFLDLSQNCHQNLLIISSLSLFNYDTKNIKARLEKVQHLI